ncbi:transcriptional regulator, TetR family [Agreia bicolorata]|uniref:Transcriptional regulator, TetR family n=2 Tax=Agreia bicolorata TaxID=110935 RepID=A0A1T4YF35_9MICO|nr:transcriptional regulator, TetR family [Agreia bicolorata]
MLCQDRCMPSPTPARRSRRTDALSAAAIIDAAIAVLDAEGEEALTFRALSNALETGPGAIYNHLANKQEILAAAAHRLVVDALADVPSDPDAENGIRAVMLAFFDLFGAHPWVGTQLSREPWQAALLEMFEAIGTHLEALGVEERYQFTAASSLLNFVLGVAGQRASATRLARDLDRSAFLRDIADGWKDEATAASHPFSCRMADQLAEHDDRQQYSDGVDFILAGITAVAVGEGL